MITVATPKASCNAAFSTRSMRSICLAGSVKEKQSATEAYSGDPVPNGKSFCSPAPVLYQFSRLKDVWGEVILEGKDGPCEFVAVVAACANGDAAAVFKDCADSEAPQALQNLASGSIGA